MTDQEITEIIATKVMGVEAFKKSWGDKDNICYIDGKGSTIWINPIGWDVDCMAAWDKFSETYATKLSGEWKAEYWDEDRIRWILAVGATQPDRRRAMCECMVEAVTS